MRKDMYVDVAAHLDGTSPEPDLLPVGDDFSLFYPGEFNLVYGDTESGKTWLCLAAVVDVLTDDGTAVIIDVDHNGALSIVKRLQQLGLDRDILTDRERFRLAEPATHAELKSLVDSETAMKPTVVTLDSLGEVLPLFRANSNNADDFTMVHTEVIKQLACAGSAVLVVDHLAKNADSRERGPTGSHAKTRAVGGLSVRVTATRPFRPGEGGTAELELNKDRHGGIRRHFASPKPIIGTFELVAKGDSLEYQVTPGPSKTKVDDTAVMDNYVKRLRATYKEETPSVRGARELLKCSMARASKAVKLAYPVTAG
ncbi:AAA family ATPase [Mycobacterium sp. BMJ-28]